MCQEIGVLPLVALCYVHHLSLKAAVIGAQHPSRRIRHSNRLVQTAGPNTVELSALQQVPAHILAE